MGGVVSVRIFGHYVSLPLVLLMLVEAAIHVGAVYLAGTLRFLDIHFVIYSQNGNYGWLLPRALLYSLVMLGVMTAFGLYGSALHKNEREYQVRFLASYPAGALVMVIVFYVIPASFPRAWHHGLELSVFAYLHGTRAGSVLPHCRRRDIEASRSRARERIPSRPRLRRC